ncbi:MULTISPECIES: DinB family protein [Streptacidiphilus]|uniref:DinB family protein n=1 Tax=Streptacidiphilus cavernicola TaxID=3342716 RepID=A0ABV6UVX1_9ACTN|nr:DinB family protein [Streptacidiphilus jeojiense]
MSTDVDKPERSQDDSATLLLGFLDYYRSTVTRKVRGLSEEELRSSRLPSGWSPLQLLKHLVYMERRWLVWGFLAEPLSDPLGDSDDDGHWQVRPEDSAAGLLAALHEGGDRTRAIVRRSTLTDVARVGGRFQDDDVQPPPTLAWTLCYVLQEYARHCGHLDIACELADGSTGE